MSPQRKRDLVRAFCFDGDADWMTDAACVSRSDLPWTGAATKRTGELMRQVCGSCPVRTQCGEYAVHARVTVGWWAGRSFLVSELSSRPRRGDAA